MAVCSFLLMWLALAVLCAFGACLLFAPCLRQTGKKDPPAGALVDALPLTVLCAVLLVLVLAGCLQALRAGMWLVLTAAAAAAGLLIWMARRTARGSASFTGTKKLSAVPTLTDAQQDDAPAAPDPALSAAAGQPHAGKAAAFWLWPGRLFARPAWLLAFGGSLLLAAILAVSQPLFTQWDEFSFWGMAAKVVKQTDALYTLAEHTNLAARSYPPALPVLGYAFSFCSPVFVPWLLLAGCGVLSFFVFGAVLGALGAPARGKGQPTQSGSEGSPPEIDGRDHLPETAGKVSAATAAGRGYSSETGGSRQSRPAIDRQHQPAASDKTNGHQSTAAIPALPKGTATMGTASRRAAAAFGALACILAPFAVECWYANQPLMAYTTAYADLLLGQLCAGGCAVWYAASADGPLHGRQLAAALTAVACVTAVLGLTKDVGLPLGLVVMLVCALDHLSLQPRTDKKARRSRKSCALPFDAQPPHDGQGQPHAAQKAPQTHKGNTLLFGTQPSPDSQEQLHVIQKAPHAAQKASQDDKKTLPAETSPQAAQRSAQTRPSPAKTLPQPAAGGPIHKILSAPCVRALCGIVCVLAVILAAALAAYLGWAAHLGAALGQDRSQTGGSAQLSTVGMLTTGLRELLGIGRSDKFSAVLTAMLSAFLHQRVSVFGSGLLCTGVIFAVLGLAYCLQSRGRRRRVVCFAVSSGLGYIGYTFFQLLCYVYVFSDADGRGLASYARYMSTYYIFWLLGALCLLLGAARAGRPAASRSVLAAAAALTAVCCLRIQPQQTLLARPAVFWDGQALIAHRAAQALDAAGGDMENEKVFLVSQWDTGARWYAYAYALEPLALLHLPGDNTVLPVDSEHPANPAEPMRLNRQSIAAFLAENGCTLLLMDVDDDGFHQEFAALFSDGLAGFDSGVNAVYRIVYSPQGVRFVPWQDPQTEDTDAPRDPAAPQDKKSQAHRPACQDRLTQQACKRPEQTVCSACACPDQGGCQ